MKLPTVQGTIRRRLLLNFRADPEVVARELPAPFVPKLHKGQAIVGVCLIRLESIRPIGVPAIIGFASENAAHRFAVNWRGENEWQEGVFIPRRDTNSLINQLAGGRVFAGEHHAADFEVVDDGANIQLRMAARDGGVTVRVSATTATSLPESSCFASVGEASKFFEPGSVGYSATSNPRKLHGVVLQTKSWLVEPLKVHDMFSSYFADQSRFPVGSIAFDHGLIMRNIEHAWHGADDLYLDRGAT